jgi:hypothetical protein
MALALGLGFRVRVAATIDAADRGEAAALHALLDAEGVPAEDRLVRPVARMGFASYGVPLTIDTLHPEPTLTADGAWWHPVAVTDPAMRVASTPLPVVTVFAVIRATVNARQADPIASLETFRCT